MTKTLSDYQRILAELKAGGMSHREAQAEASNQNKALKEAAEANKPEGAKPAKGGKKVEKIEGAGATTKPEPKKPIVVGLTVDDEVLENCIEKIDEAIEACNEAAIAMKNIAGKGGRFARAATKMRQIRKFHIK